MEKNIKDYLHLYLGCGFRWQWKEGDELKQGVLDAFLLQELYFHKPPYKQWLILRQLSDMTEEEHAEAYKLYFDAEIELLPWFHKAHFNLVRYFLSKHFDLFGLIEAGLAIDATTVNNKK